MAYEEALASRIRAALKGVRPVEEKRMFGGLAFMVRRRMCMTVGQERIMVRSDPAHHDAVLKRKGSRPVVMGAESTGDMCTSMQKQ